MRKLIFSILILICYFLPLNSQSRTKTKEDYLNAIKETEQKIWEAYEHELVTWQKAEPISRSTEPPKPNFYNGAKCEAFLYSVTGEMKYAQRARKLLLESPAGDHTVQSIRFIEKSGVLTNNDLRILEDKLVEAAGRAVEYWTEWGAMNHATNHVVNLLTAVMDYLPNHPNYKIWKQKRDINLSSSWGLWSIEDAQIYIPIWLKPMMEYAEMAGKEKEFYRMPMTKYYFDYFVQLIAPYGGVAEFGDGGMHGFMYYISCLEKGASVYRDGRMKWAAHQIFQSQIVSGEGKAVAAAVHDWVDAYRWADDSIPEEIPSDESRLVLEDYVGKKVVFRNSWEPDATYLFLNYLEDSPFGIDGKEHIIQTIPVETEKNHHGHADENSICLLMKNGSVLLHDSGYRETWSTGPDGQYRADIFHNKLVVRHGIADPQMRLMPFLLIGGRYPFVETKLMHFRRFKEVNISRTRLMHQETGYQWDRLISYLKEKDWFVIFDIVKILRDDAYTITNLFYSQDIVEFDEMDRNWYDTRYRTLGYYHTPNPGEEQLLIYFPEGNLFRRGVEQIRRCYQTSSAVYATKADSFKQDDILVFTTLLIPHSIETDPKSIISSLSDLKIYHKDNGYGIQIPSEDDFIQINAMLNLEAEYLKENVRPRYNFESGKSDYGKLTTDARYCYLHSQKNKLFYSFFKASKLIWNDKPIFQAKSEMVGQDDGTYRKLGTPKWIAWEDEVDLKN